MDIDATGPIDELIRELRRSDAYPVPPTRVEVVQTHASVVFLTSTHAWKIKKPVDFGFLDYSTLELRQHWCREEVRVNRRLAPTVYLGVVPVTRAPGGLRFGGDGGDAVEWAVKMRQLDDADTLGVRLRDGRLDDAMVADIGRRIARFHADDRGGDDLAPYGAFDAVAFNARENLEQTREHRGDCVSPELHARVRDATERGLTSLRDAFERRAGRGATRDCHGDLRLEHVYVHDDGEIDIIDAIEFNARFRFADPVSDLAFLAMELSFAGRDDLVEVLWNTWRGEAEASDEDASRVFPFYVAYRSVVRAKVRGLKAKAPEVDVEARRESTERARGHWLLALRWLEPPHRRPALAMVTGLPGTGKSTLARGLAEQAGFMVLRADEVRKELFGLSAEVDASSAWGEGIYTEAATEQTYAALLDRARDAVDRGDRVLVDATLRTSERREPFEALARARAVPAVTFVLDADAALIEARIQARGADASDADVAVFRRARATWQPPRGAGVERLDASPPADRVLDRAMSALVRRGLATLDHTASDRQESR